MKKLVVFFLALITAFNLAVSVPKILKACACYYYDQNNELRLKCTGDCCGGATGCDCYDVGTDNCTKAPGGPQE